MDDNDILAELQKYAEKKLNAGRYPDDTHRFKPKGCSRCGRVPLALTIEPLPLAEPARSQRHVAT